MNLQLDRFEKQIDKTILKRGYDYFLKGCVTDVDDLGNGEYEATVEGTETYTVWLHLAGNKITKWECDCPYDLGAICKHVVAVLYYLQQNSEEESTDFISPKGKTQSKPGKESETQQINRLLKRLTHEELKAFVQKACTQNKKLREQFITKYISTLYPISKEIIIQRIDKLSEAYTDKYDFIHYDEAAELSEKLYDMAEEAITDVQKGNTRSALYTAEAIIEKTIELLEYADDSYGEISGSINRAFDVLDTIAEKEDLDTETHEELFDWLLTCFEQKTMSGWDWHFNLIEKAIKIVKSDKEKKRIRKALEQIKLDENDWNWNYKNAQELMSQLIRKTEGENAAFRFMESRLSIPEFRKELIEKAMRKNQLEKAKELAEEGLAHDKQKMPGLEEDWNNYLLEISQITGYKKRSIDLARQFLIQSACHHHPRRYYYDLLKSLVPQEQWTEQIESLVAEISQGNKTNNRYEEIAELYIWEKQWESLFGLLQQYPDFDRIENAEKYLKKKHAKDLASMYRDNILSYMKHYMGREHYQTACAYIRRMIKLGEEPMAMELVETLKTTYHKRRALLEELARICRN